LIESRRKFAGHRRRFGFSRIRLAPLTDGFARRVPQISRLIGSRGKIHILSMLKKDKRRRRGRRGLSPNAARLWQNSTRFYFG